MGRRITAPPPVIAPDRVAAAIERLADKPKPTTMIGITSVLTRFLHALNPTLTTQTMARAMTAYFERAEPVATSEGNLFETPADAGVTTGGIRSAKQRAMAGAAAGSVVGALALAKLIGRCRAHTR